MSRRDVGDHGSGQGGGLVDFPSAFGDGAFVGELEQDALQLDAVGIFRRTRGRFPACDLAGLARTKATMASARKTIVVFIFNLSRPCRALFAAFGCSGGLRRRCLGGGGDRARALRRLPISACRGFLGCRLLQAWRRDRQPVSSLGGGLLRRGLFFAPRFGLPPPLAARSSISAMASASVIVSGSYRSGSCVDADQP